MGRKVPPSVSQPGPALTSHRLVLRFEHTERKGDLPSSCALGKSAFRSEEKREERLPLLYSETGMTLQPPSLG